MAKGDFCDAIAFRYGWSPFAFMLEIENNQFEQLMQELHQYRQEIDKLTTFRREVKITQ